MSRKIMSIKDEAETDYHENEFEPDWASPPGDTIKDIMEEKGLTEVNVRIGLGLSAEEVLELFEGTMSITEELADKLEKTLGGTKQFWLNREEQYRETLERLKGK